MIVTQGSKPVSATTPIKARKGQRSERQKAVGVGYLPLKAVASQQQQIAVLQRWSEMAQLSQVICKQQQAELSYRYLYSALEQLRRPLQHNFQPQLSTTELQLLQQQVGELVNWRAQSASALDAELYPQQKTAALYQAVLNARIDLLSPRPQHEQISILFGRTGATVSLQLAAEASAELNLQHIQQAFAREQISVQLNAQQQLVFSAVGPARRKLEENWLMTGEGVRVAAGNPVAISLTQPLCRLGRLQLALQAQTNPASLAALLNDEQQFLRAQLKNLQQQQAAMNLQINTLAPKIQPDAAAALLESSALLQNTMQAGTPAAINAFVAQAQVSAYLVRFALKPQRND